MAKSNTRTAITPTREEDFPNWYQEVVKVSDMAEHSPVRGCMVIKPWGYAIWEKIQAVLDKKFKETGHENAYFPLFIPLSYFEKEAAHVDGFAKECAVVTHHRLSKDKDGRLVPSSKLEEPLVVRPTSEMIIGEMFSRWIQSHRDLPVLMNQWANVVRWEMRTRTFLRTTEFLWQEGHTAHASQQEAIEEAEKMLDVYEEFVRTYLAMPVLTGVKSPNETFPGAVTTYCFEAMMQDGKALQGGTSHFLGQNFAKAASIKFQNQEGQQEYVWTTSWGITTRLIGSMIMMHGDDDGLIVPPKVVRHQVILIPIIHNEDDKQSIISACERLKEKLKATHFNHEPVRVHIDQRDLRGGEKNWDWIKKGAPIRIEVGKREIEKKEYPVALRTKHFKDKFFLSEEETVHQISDLLEQVHASMYKKAHTFMNEHIHDIQSKREFDELFTKHIPKGKTRGFAKCFWSGDVELEEKIKSDLGVTIRCIQDSKQEGECIFTGQSSSHVAYFAFSY